MDAQLELANQRIQELEERLKKYRDSTEDQLFPLPNGDLYRGLRLGNTDKANIDTEVLPESMGNPLNRAIAQILKAAKGGHNLTCLWCGLQWNGQGAEHDVREHLKKDHPSVVEGYDKIVPELLMANLEEAKARLAE